MTGETNYCKVKWPGFFLLVLSLTMRVSLAGTPLSDDQLYYQTQKAQRAEWLYKAGFISTTIGLFLAVSPDAAYVPSGIPVVGDIMYPVGWAAMVGSMYWQCGIAGLVTGKDLTVPKYTWLSLAGGFLFLVPSLVLKHNDHPVWAATCGAGGLACHVFSYLKVSETKHIANKLIWDRALGKGLP